MVPALPWIVRQVILEVKSGVCDAARDPPSTNAVANDGINGLAIWSSASVCADIFNLVFQDHKRNQNSTGR